MSEIRPQVERDGSQVGFGRRNAPGLTGRDGGRRPAALGDPAGFIVGLEQELRRMRRHGDSSCLMIVAPDRPVTVRSMDLLGARFAACLRSYDALCRYGANHFLILLPHVREDHVAGIARRLRIQVAAYAVETADGIEQFVAATIGSAMLDPAETMNGNIDRALQSHERAAEAERAVEKPPAPSPARGVS